MVNFEVSETGFRVGFLFSQACKNTSCIENKHMRL